MVQGRPLTMLREFVTICSICGWSRIFSPVCQEVLPNLGLGTENGEDPVEYWMAKSTLFKIVA